MNPSIVSESLPLNIALAANERFFPGLWCTVASALAHTQFASNWTITVVDYGISSASWHQLESVVASHPSPPVLLRTTLSDELVDSLHLPPSKSSIAFARLFFPQLFQSSTVLYLDSDLLIFRDLNELAQISLAGYACAAVVNEDGRYVYTDLSEDACSEYGLYPFDHYYNSGLLLMNLDEWRSQGLSSKCVQFIRKYSPYHIDQSAINAVMGGQIMRLDCSWNRLVGCIGPQELARFDYVLHYTGTKPWFVARDVPEWWIFAKFCSDTGFMLPKVRQPIIDLFNVSIVAFFRGVFYSALSALFSILANSARAKGYGSAASYWYGFCAARLERKIAWKHLKSLMQTHDLNPAGISLS